MTGETPPLTDDNPQIFIDRVCKSYSDFMAVNDVSLNIYKGEMFALVGGSGCGKTTLLRMLAGFAEPSAGSIKIDGADMAGIPPYQRPVNMMFQSYALFPHMSVATNIAYGLRRLRLARHVVNQKVNEALDLVQLGGLATRKPHQLSGGQRQRVALARALIRRPKVLLLDEPLSALDKKLREETQFALKIIQRQLGITFVIVTHDQDEAMALSTRIGVMNQGRVVQVGTPANIYEFPSTRFVAEFIGNTNVFEGIVTATHGEIATIRCEEIRCDCEFVSPSRPSLNDVVAIALRPEKIRLKRHPEPDLQVNQIQGVVIELGYLGNHSTYRIRTCSGRVITAMAQNGERTAERTINLGDDVYLAWSQDAAIPLPSPPIRPV